MTGSTRDGAVIALAALASHVASLGAGFIWLDHAHIEEGLALAQLSDFLSLFKSGFAGTGYYRPLMSLSLSLDAALGGQPLLYHATSLFWHAAAAVLTAVAAQQLGLSRRAAYGAALLFAVHPVTSLVANAVAFRSESMIAVALLSLIVLHLRGTAWASAVVLLAGALTKETALVLGPLMVLALELLVPLTARRPLPARVRLLASEALALALALGLRSSFAPSWRAGFPELLPGQALGTRLASLGKSAFSLLLPTDNAVCDAFPITSAAAPAALAGLAVLVLLCYLAYHRRGPAVLLCLAVLPSLQLVPVMRWWSPHYMYLPLAFAAMLFVEGVERWAPRAMHRLPPLALALGGLSLFEARRYHSDERFFSREIKLAPACREAHFYLGEVARGRGRLDDAATHYERAIRPTPGILSYVDRAATLQNLGVVQLQQERFDAARDTFRAALGALRDEAAGRRVTHNLATAALRSGRPVEAAELLAKEVERPDALPASIFIRARAMQALGRRAEAESLLRRLPRNP